MLGLVPEAGDILPRCPWVPARRVARQIGSLGSMSELTVGWGPWN